MKSINRNYHGVYDADIDYTLLQRNHKECPVMPIQKDIMEGLPTFVNAADDKEQWIQNRKSMNELFSKHHGREENIDDAINAITDYLDTWKEKPVINIANQSGILSLKFLCASLFQVEITTTEANIIDQLTDSKIQNRLLATAITRAHLPNKLLNAVTGFNTAQKNIQTIINNLRNRADSKSKIHDLENDQLFELLFTGSVTTKATLYHAALLLSQHKDWQEKIANETQEKGIPKKLEKPNKEGNIPAVTMTTMETMRLFPSIPHIPREMAVDLKLKNGTSLRKGDRIIVLPMSIHRNPRYYQDPDKFSPDQHFSMGAIKERPKGSYMPFGFGPSGCPGQGLALQQVNTILSAVFSRFSLDWQGEMPKTKSKTTLLADRNVYLKMTSIS